MTKNITNRQLFFILLLTLTSFSVVNIAKIMAQYAGNGYWVTIFITMIFFSFVAVTIVKLNNIHKNKMIYDYSTELVGPVLTYIISLFYFFYFMMIVVFLVMQMSVILKANFLDQTPMWASMLVGIPVYCYIAYKGINTIARMIEFFGIIYLIIAVTVHILMFTQGHVYRILPLFNMQDVIKYLKAIKYAIFPFLGIEILLFIPFNNRDGKKSVRTAFFSIITIGVFYVLIIATCIMKLGLNSIIHYKDALLFAIRDMNVPLLDFFKRLDVLFLTVGFIGFFMGISIVYTVLTELILKVFVKLKRVLVVVILAVSSYLLCLIANMIHADFSKFVQNVGTFLGLTAAAVIPTILLIITKVKNNEA